MKPQALASHSQRRDEVAATELATRSEDRPGLPDSAATWLTFAGLSLDRLRRLLLIDGYQISLGTQNAVVLGLLMQAGGDVVTAEQIHAAMVVARADIAVSNLRRRLHNLGVEVAIVTHRQRGWCLHDPSGTSLATFADLTLDPASRRLTSRGHPPVTLAAGSAAVLELLIRSPKGLVAATEIQRLIGSAPVYKTIANLRARLATINASAVIVNHHNAGWSLADPTTSASLRFACLTLNPGTRRLAADGCPSTTLGTQSASALALLIRAHGAPVTANQIERAVGAARGDAIVGHLGNRLSRMGAPVAIVNEFGRGWRLVDLSSEPIVSFAGLTLVLGRRRLLVPGGPSIVLGPQPATTLSLLLRARGDLVSARQIEQAVGSRTAGAIVRDLGNRLGQVGAPVVITNRYGHGWMLTPSGQPRLRLRLRTGD